MERVIYRVSLDVNKNGIQKTIQGFETGDVVAKELHITLRNGKENYELPSDNSVVATMKVTKPSGDGADLQPCTIDENGEIIYVVQPSDIEQMGTSIFQLELIGNVYRKDLLTGSNNSNVVDGVRRQRGVIVAPRFAIEVWESEYVSSSATTTYTFGMLEQALLEARSYYNHTFDHFEVDTDTYHIKICFKDGRTYENDQLNIIMDGIKGETGDIEEIKLELSKKLNQIEPTVLGTLTVNGNIEPRGSIYANGEIKAQKVEAPTLLATNYASSPVIVTTLIDHPSSSGEISVQADTDFTDTLYYRTSANTKKSLKALDTEVSNKVNKSNPSTTGNFYHSGNFNASGMITGDLYYKEESIDGGDFIPKPAQSVSGKFEALDSIDSTLTTKTTELDTRVTALEEKPSGSASFTLESASPLEYATNNNIVGLYAEGKSEQYISPNLLNINATSGTAGGITYTINADKSVTVSGSRTSASSKIIGTAELKSGDEFTFGVQGDMSGLVAYIAPPNGGEALSKTLPCTITATDSGTWTFGLKGRANGDVASGTGFLIVNKGSSVIPYEPYTGTPSPTNPIPIKDASGVVEAHTRNLFNPKSFISGSSYSIADDVITENVVGNQKIAEFTFKGGVTYSVKSLLVNGTLAPCIIVRNLDGTTTDQKTNYANTSNPIQVLFASDTTKQIMLQASSASGSSAVGTKTKIQIEQGTTASEYVEYKSNAIAIDDANILTTTAHDGKTANVNYSMSSIGITRLNGTPSEDASLDIHRDPSKLMNGLVAGKTYNIGVKFENLANTDDVKFEVYAYVNGAYDSAHRATLGSEKTVEWTLPSGATGMLVRILLVRGKVYNNLVVKPIISDADIPTLDINLRSIGNIVDTLTVNEDGSGEWVQKVGMRDLEKLNWTFGWSTAWYTDNITDGVAPSIESIANIMSDSYVAKSMSPSPSTSKVGEMGYWASSETKRLACNNGSSTAKPSGILYYELATPIVHTLTKEQVDAIRQLKTYEGTTLIDAELQNVKVKYQGDIKGYIDSKFDTLYSLIRQYHPDVMALADGIAELSEVIENE